MITPESVPVARRLMEIDAKIAEVAGMTAELIRRGATLGRVEDEVAFLRVLFRRRETILNEYRKAGGELADPYTFSERAIR